MRAEDIMDEESLRAWLQARPKADAVVIAYRAAMRVFPLWVVEKSYRPQLARISALPIIVPLFLAETAILGILSAPPERPHNVADLRYRAIEDSGDTGFTRLVEMAILVLNSTILGAPSRGDVSDSIKLSASFGAPFPFWRALRHDVRRLGHYNNVGLDPLWPEEISSLQDGISVFEAEFLADWSQSPEIWDFWRRWWIGARDGKPLDWDLQKRVALIPAEEWEKNDPAHIAALIREIEEDFNRGTTLSRAFPVDFTFAAFARLMRMVGIDDDTAHLRDPKVVRNFLDDCTEARDKLNDFIDYARELGGGANHAGVMRLAAEKIVRELDHCRDTTHARARRLVSLGRDLERFAADEKNRGDLRDSLAETLDEGLALFRNVTRKHFGPAYAALAPLAQLTLEHVDQDAAIALLDDKIGWLEGLKRNDPDFVALDAEGIAVFNDMLREARDIRAAMAEATSDEFREMLESKLAESLGGTGLALGRFVVQSAKAADKATDEFDKRARQVKTLADILKMLGFIGPAW